MRTRFVPIAVAQKHADILGVGHDDVEQPIPVEVSRSNRKRIPAGQRSIRTTMRYMHLSPSHKEKAIELLDQARSEEGFGDILETQHPVLEKTEAACRVDE